MADLSLIVLTLLWGTTFVFVKGALVYATPGAFLVARLAVATAVLAVCWRVSRPHVDGALVRRASSMGLAMFAGYALQTAGLLYTTPARSAFLTGLAVLIVPFVARFLYRRPVGGSVWLGVLLAVVGLYLLTRPFADGITADIRLGDALTAGCAVAFAFLIVWTGEWAPLHPLVPLTAIQVGVTFLGTIAYLVLEPAPRFEPTASLLATVAYCGAVMTAAAFFVQNWGQRKVTAVRAALIYALEPPAAAAFAHFYTGERLTPADLAGGGLIVAGVICGELGARKSVVGSQ
jgi:drug/metabolite transporter (DMT)-like permease